MFQILISSSPTRPPGIEEDEQVSHEQVFEYILYSFKDKRVQVITERKRY